MLDPKDTTAAPVGERLRRMRSDPERARRERFVAAARSIAAATPANDVSRKQFLREISSCAADLIPSTHAFANGTDSDGRMLLSQILKVKNLWASS
jgi:hypothetical protein